jgi:hypothetical protein
MRSSTLEELKAWWTPAKSAAQAREVALLDEKYPGHYVAYIDEWSGEELKRTVVAVARELAEFQHQLAALAPDVRQRIVLTNPPPENLIVLLSDEPEAIMRWSTLEELKALRVRTVAQKAALREADSAMDEKYAGNYVAYIDTWTGDTLTREVVAVAVAAAEFHGKLAALSPDVRARVQLTQIPDADTFSVPSAWLA